MHRRRGARGRIHHLGRQWLRPDGSDIGYGGQIVRRNNRFVLPIQAKARIDAKFRTAFDYRCRLEMPGDPIAPATRADCISLK
jgi:hypothetical protein